MMSLDETRAFAYPAQRYPIHYKGCQMFKEKPEPVLAVISVLIFAVLAVYLIVSDTDLIGPF